MFAASKTDSVSDGGYQISRSLRFNSADSAYLDRAQTTGNTQIATWSGWVKRSALTIGAFSTLFSAGTSNTDSFTFSNTGDTLRFFLNGSLSADLVTTQVFRDPSSWYHIVVAIDTTQATAANRIKLYVNGVQVTSFSTEIYPTQNYTFTSLNTSGKSANLGSIGTGSYLSAYMTEVNFIDGQQLTPSSFGETNTQTGVWQPKAFSGGAYGTNGFYLNFSDNSNTTAATLGKDYSGNGNNWTPNNFSVSAGAGNDSLVDVPTPYGIDTGVGGTVRGNYCTLNPLGTAGAVSTNGNLSISNGSTVGNRISTFLLTSGKWYWEAMGEGYVGTIIGVDGTQYTGSVSGTGSKSIGYWFYGPAYWDGGSQSGGPTYTSSDVIGVALDMDIGNVKFYKNNTLIYDLTFGSGTIPNLSSGVFAGYNIGGGTYSVDFNFGQRPFVYTAPSNFKAICTQNLPTPTIGATSETQAGKFFAPAIYTGNGTSQSLTLGFQPDFTWIKVRNMTYSNLLTNAVTGGSNYLVSNSTGAEAGGQSLVTAWTSTGVTLGSWVASNESTLTYVAWNWKASNATAVTNTAGTITSQVSASTTSGFSVVTYTGNGIAGATRGHGLGVAPNMILVKGRTNVDSWHVYHSSLGNTSGLLLNSDSGSIVSPYFWNDTSPSSTVFTTNLGTSNNANGVNYVAYCFASVAGYSAFGSYTGNGSADGPFVFTGFRPAYVMIKLTSSGGYWWMIKDATRDPYNTTSHELYANVTDAEYTGSGYALDFLSNGFKIKATSTAYNGSGSTYIYMAFAESPFKFSLARQD